jgi:hypothetical protein
MDANARANQLKLNHEENNQSAKILIRNITYLKQHKDDPIGHILSHQRFKQSLITVSSLLDMESSLININCQIAACRNKCGLRGNYYGFVITCGYCNSGSKVRAVTHVAPYRMYGATGITYYEQYQVKCTACNGLGYTTYKCNSCTNLYYEYLSVRKEYETLKTSAYVAYYTEYFDRINNIYTELTRFDSSNNYTVDNQTIELENVPVNVPEKVPENVPENISVNVPEDIPENISVNVPEDIPEKVPEAVPVIVKVPVKDSVALPKKVPVSVKKSATVINSEQHNIHYECTIIDYLCAIPALLLCCCVSKRK